MVVVVRASKSPDAAWVARIEVVPTARIEATFPTTLAIFSSVTEKVHAPFELDVGGVNSMTPTPHVVVTGAKGPKLGVTALADGVERPMMSPEHTRSPRIRMRIDDFLSLSRSDLMEKKGIYAIMKSTRFHCTL
jgi:hypothetical protein